jgi:hypothetical protein
LVHAVISEYPELSDCGEWVASIIYIYILYSTVEENPGTNLAIFVHEFLSS